MSSKPPTKDQLLNFIVSEYPFLKQHLGVINDFTRQMEKGSNVTFTDKTFSTEQNHVLMAMATLNLDASKCDIIKGSSIYLFQALCLRFSKTDPFCDVNKQRVKKYIESHLK
jgi:hypothetical protein